MTEREQPKPFDEEQTVVYFVAVITDGFDPDATAQLARERLLGVSGIEAAFIDSVVPKAVA